MIIEISTGGFDMGTLIVGSVFMAGILIGITFGVIITMVSYSRRP